MKAHLFLAAILLCTVNKMTAVQTPARPPVSGAPAPAPTPAPASAGPTAPATPAPVADKPASPGVAAPAVEPAKFVPAPDGVFWIVFATMTLVILVGVGAVSRILRSDRDWSFADALSGSDGKPSSSRMIAFLGFLVLIAIILGVGYSSLWVFLKTGQLPSLSGASTFLLACAGLFAPYFANQIGLAIGGQPSQTGLAPVVLQTASPTPAVNATGVPNVTFGSPVRPVL